MRESLVMATLGGAGHRCAVVGTGAAALRTARAVPPDIVLLDLGLPDTDGTTLCAELSKATDAHIVALSAAVDEVTRVLTLTLGADDYLTKPFSPRELLARIAAIERRRGRELSSQRTIGNVNIEPDLHHVTVGGRVVDLTRTEMAVLAALAEHAGRVLTRQGLAEAAIGPGADPASIASHVSNIRRKLGPEATARVEAVRGVGYRLVEELNDD